MKKRLHDKQAGIAILAVIFVISLADVILRATTFREIASTASNYGEALINASFSLTLLVFALKVEIFKRYQFLDIQDVVYCVTQVGFHFPSFHNHNSL